MIEIFNFNNIVGVLINSFAYIYLWSKLLGEKIDFTKYKYYIVHLLFALTMLLNYLLVNEILRILVMIIIMYIFCRILYKRNHIKELITAFISQLIMMLSELIFVIIITGLLRVNLELFMNYFVGKIMGNLGISLIAIIIIRFKLPFKLFGFIEKLLNTIGKNKIFFIMVTFLVSINFIFLAIYNKLNFAILFIVNSIIFLLYLIISFKFLTTESKYNKISDKYDTTLNSLKEYEEILDVYRVSSHENKNQLLTIRSMIIKKEKNIPEYIDKIIDNNIKDDEKLMFDTNAIPAGGLRAVIYSKLLVMKDKKIKFNLNVDRKVRTVELIDLGEDLMLDVCKVIGVFLDNSIEAVSDLKKKNISINLFADEEILNIEISNNYKGDIDLTKIDDKGYTSKSDGHGYGLSLVKEIINKNKKLENERKINKNIFTQKLKIKIK